MTETETKTMCKTKTKRKLKVMFQNEKKTKTTINHKTNATVSATSSKHLCFQTRPSVFSILKSMY